MDFSVEKKISNFIESQFPQFYLDEGENFIAFTKAYYEWMETEGGAIYGARNIFEFRDIDKTPDTMPWNEASLNGFLEHFQRKYLYSIPFNTIINKRFLLKHILDVYRSKGTISCYKLLFRLIYNEDVDVYLPGVNVLRLSDGKWNEPRYLEVSDSTLNASFVGKKILGIGSGTTAIIESYSRSPINEQIIGTFQLSNILPKGGNFTKGEKLITVGDENNGILISAAPVVIGSLETLSIINGGQDYKVGDVVKIAHLSLTGNGAAISYGIDGSLRVTETTTATGAMHYEILNRGFGVTANSLIFQYKTSANGTGAAFALGPLAYTVPITYNTDNIADYLDTALNATAYGFPGAATANATTGTIGSALTFATQTFGSISTLTNMFGGNAYTSNLNVIIRSTLDVTNAHSGNITYSSTSNTITGVGTSFERYFAANSVILLQANSSNNNSKEYAVIKTVTSNTSMTLYGPPSYNSVANLALHRVSPVILPSNFAQYETTVSTNDGTYAGINSQILASPVTGSGVISGLSSVNSGRGYVDQEVVEAYLYAGLAAIRIEDGGTAYSNGDMIVFAGVTTGTRAAGYVTTYANGTIIAATMTTSGSGYTGAPKLTVRSLNGTGARLTTNVTEFNEASKITGRVIKGGVGKTAGFWSTDDGFLDANKYIQDSYFYQDFSYQIKTAATLDKYKNLLYDTFHTAGAQLFGEFNKTMVESVTATIDTESTAASYLSSIFITTDTNTIKTDSNFYTADQL